MGHLYLSLEGQAGAGCAIRALITSLLSRPISEFVSQMDGRNRV